MRTPRKANNRVVYDVTNRESFDAISWWFAERSKYAPKLAIKMIVGNKSDKVSLSPPLSSLPFPSSARAHRTGFASETSECSRYTRFFASNSTQLTQTTSSQNHVRQVSTAEGAAYASQMGCLFVETSAKTAVGVREAFRDVVERILPQ